MLDTPSGCCCIARASLARAGPPNLKGPKYTCKRGGLRLPAPRPHQPQMHLRAHAAARKSPRLFCRFCGNPHAAASPGLGRIFELYAARGTCWFAG